MDKYRDMCVKMFQVRKEAIKDERSREAAQLEVGKAMRSMVNQNAQDARQREADREQDMRKAALEADQRREARRKEREAQVKFTARLNAVIRWSVGLLSHVWISCLGHSMGAVSFGFAMSVSGLAMVGITALTVYAVRLVLKEKKRREANE